MPAARPRRGERGRHRAVRAERRQRGRRPRVPAGRLDFLGIPAVIERDARARSPAQPVHAFESLYEADREARGVAAELVGAGRSRA